MRKRPEIEWLKGQDELKPRCLEAINPLGEMAIILRKPARKSVQ